MSSRLIKNGSTLEIVGDEVIATIRILKSGQIQVEAPSLHPAMLIKYLQNTIVDITYASFQPAEMNRIQPPV